MKQNGNKILLISGAVIILLLIISLTSYAYFAAQAGGTTSTNATVTSNTTDLLTFSINRDISFTVTQANFAENGTNQSGDATATATLTPNNKTGAATMHYYLYLNIESNPISYSSENLNGDPELMLQVFNSSNQLVTLSDLGNQVTVKGVTGYDITALEGPIVLLDNHAISASNNTATIENWRVVITLINLDVIQNDNTGKEVSAELIIQRDELDLGYTGTIYRNNTRIAFNNHPIEDEMVNVWCVDSNCTNYFASKEICEFKMVTCIQDLATIGVGTYETNVNMIRTSYDYYLKHEVEGDIINDTKVCLYYNNHEFCLGPNYWIGDSQDEIDGATTKNKLKTEMENAFGVQADSCNSARDDAVCNFGEYECLIYSNGNALCGLTMEMCFVGGDGTSACERQ